MRAVPTSLGTAAGHSSSWEPALQQELRQGAIGSERTKTLGTDVAGEPLWIAVPPASPGATAILPCAVRKQIPQGHRFLSAVLEGFPDDGPQALPALHGPTDLREQSSDHGYEGRDGREEWGSSGFRVGPTRPRGWSSV